MKFSVIIPVYNTEHFLKKCLDSVVNQTYSNLEIIIVNDGSTDSSKQIIEDYAKIDSRIIAIHQENGGIGSAYRAAFKIMTGVYISFVDSDDYISLNMFNDLAREKNETKADIVHFGRELFDDNNKIISQYKVNERKVTESNTNILIEHFEVIKDPSLACRIFKKELFEYVILFNQNVGIDEILYPQLLLNAKLILHIPDIYYFVLIRNTSVSRSKHDIKKIDEYIKVHRFLCELFEKEKTQLAFYTYIKYLVLALPIYDSIKKKIEYKSTNVLLELKNDLLLYYNKLMVNGNLNKLSIEMRCKLFFYLNLPSFYSTIFRVFWIINGIKSKYIN